MRTTFLALTLLALSAGVLPAWGENALLGTWQYDGFFYDNHRYPNPNPNLILRFTFEPNGVSRLKWYRKDENGFCERLADYKIHDGDFLNQKVTWINPGNAPDCGKDPDMQMGKESDNRFSIQDGELSLHFELNGKEFLYILRRCDPNLTVCPENQIPIQFKNQ